MSDEIVEVYVEEVGFTHKAYLSSRTNGTNQTVSFRIADLKHANQMVDELNKFIERMKA